MIRRQIVSIYLLTLTMGAGAVAASAEETQILLEPRDSPAATVAAPASLSTLFQGARRPAPAPTPTSDHIFGVGIRLGGYSFGVGGTVRYFVTGPWGVQAEVSRYGIGIAG